MASNDKERKRVMDSSIRRLIGSEANRSYLRSLPTFRVERTLPADLVALLEQLERAEGKPQQRRN
jgi:hypothetical protein